MTDCVFCKIVSGEIPSKRVYEDDQVIVINDLNPGAPVHVLVIPKEHTENILTASPEILVHVKKVLPEIVKKLGIAEKGFRVVVNTGVEGGQTVPHLHFHILGGKELGWPPC
ncbi:histidine triad nucleotide-binding protein [Acidaminococcus fermentans]|uniref:Histidine triad (HIT) protein n=4 Tax=Acidaminococcus fermentans TaxID=905 RepID=D2RJ52_ACIFV|nr:histidine triad nucleotide-binding protein [Acidaminococcus fermentans]ADB47104.1 histidine triad (HIT) protein [Acidaminococcus fermentans DSM 20731]MCF0138980.1 histidine triad nucleotide-binding protein [Acidaminococcus fermentans]MCI7194868.1 histidine triad nucleotide-binding protein [Acidaminococcus fermentans]MDD7194864.1 histidine triad nucleotide-binding protein [Acidaminococcus fermentans]MDY2852343.1 histidine triad nucleotide-binding protein [Acidaminococcus fermentans]